jgi:hypothetical protein
VTATTLALLTLRGIGRWRDPGDLTSFKVLTVANGNLYHADSGGNVWTSLKTGLTDVKGDFATMRNIVVFTNGTNTPIQYDGTTADDLGLAAPSAAPSATLVAGSLTGTFQYALTYVRGTVESNASATVTVSPSAQNVSLSWTAPPADVDNVRVYRTTDGGSSLLRLKEIAAATLSYTDDGSDTLSSTAVDTDHDTPPAGRYAAYYAGYAFLAKDQTIYWSKALQPDYWPTANSTDVPFEDNDHITGLYAFEDALIIFGNRNILLLTGSGGNWSITRAQTDVGAIAHRSIVEVPGGIVFLSRDGIYKFPGLEPIAPQLHRELSQETLANMQASAGVYVPEERSVWFSVGTKTYTIHLLNQAAGKYSFTSPGFLAGGDDGFSNPLMLDNDEGYINEYTGSNDLGTDISVAWKSKTFQLANPELVKHFRRIGAFATQGASGAVTVTITDQATTHTVTLESDTVGSESLWDSFTWDVDSWSFEGVSYFVGSLPAQTLLGRNFEVSITADVNTETTVLPPLTFEYRESQRFL